MTNDVPQSVSNEAASEDSQANGKSRSRTEGWRTWFARKPSTNASGGSTPSDDENNVEKERPERWSMGVLNDKTTEEVPGTVLLMSNTDRNEPLGLQNAPARTSASSLPSPFPRSRSPSERPSLGRRISERPVEEKKYTSDGKIILEPQPEDTPNDPLNWPSLRRDVALLSIGFYCMLGGGMTPVLAAGFPNVAKTYRVSVPQVALTTGLYMMGLGLGSVIASPTAIIWGKRPVYLVGIILFIISSIWCALSPNYASLVVARIFMGLAVSPCECLPSANIAEIFYLHERAYRLGVYTLLLLGGKNLIPLVSAAIIESLGWRWVFWIVAIVVGLCWFLMFLFVPETFWDRTPRPHAKRRQGLASLSTFFHHPQDRKNAAPTGLGKTPHDAVQTSSGLADQSKHKGHHVGFLDQSNSEAVNSNTERLGAPDNLSLSNSRTTDLNELKSSSVSPAVGNNQRQGQDINNDDAVRDAMPRSISPPKGPGPDRLDTSTVERRDDNNSKLSLTFRLPTNDSSGDSISEKVPAAPPLTSGQRYTSALRSQPPKTYLQTLRPWNGKLRDENWFYVGLRPFILFAYPSILWSALIYSLSVGWLIVLSEAVSEIYKGRDTYNFTSLQAGLVYISPFVGGILGTAVAGKVSDIIVRYMSRRNSGFYEPEFRLVMAIPITISTCIGLMGFGWSAEEKDKWIVPTIFFGVISFGCSLGSTTAITFAVDSYRQFAGEALVTLNFSKSKRQYNIAKQKTNLIH
ncbi:uncharacterized protein KY384_000953 [Bacidia gigantensis]|uniref:uncharacterized protein n=1 Tax=Bacidia gigantensis TaxID=2732470 RepID=UPI001D03C67B|nr:uncharacterized protein KY384_000953 [Bacidia gigantensis]KAG8534109.1 hypothetical protein KY384_000953 [Bacidia gigantensis]